MNKSRDVEILKALLPYSQEEPIRGILALKEELKKSPGLQRVNYATTFRHTQELIEKGFITAKEGIRKNGLPDKRDTKHLSLTTRGAVYLILNSGDLSEMESRAIIQKILFRPEFKKLELTKNLDILQIPIDTLRSSFSRIRPKINLDYFNEDYALELLFNEVVVENCLEMIIERKKRVKNAKSKDEEMIRKAKSDMYKLTSGPEYAKFREVYKMVRDHLIDQKAILNSKIALLKPFY